MRFFFCIIILISQNLYANENFLSDIDDKTKSQIISLIDSIENLKTEKEQERLIVQFDRLTANYENEFLKAKSLYYNGILEWNVTDYPKAINLFYQSLQIAEEINDSLTVINNSIYLGLVYGRLNDWEMTEKYYKKAYEKAHNFNSTFYKAIAAWNMAFLFSQRGNYPMALGYCDESMKNLDNTQFTSEYQKHFGYGLTYYYYGLNYYNSEMYDSSLKYMKLSLRENEQISQTGLTISAIVMLSYIYYELGDFARAIDYGMQVINTKQDLQDTENLAWSYESVANAYDGLRLPDSAFKYMKLYANTLDTLNKIDTRIQSVKLELNKQEKDFLREQELANQRYNFTIVIALGFIAFLATVLFLSYSRIKLKNKLNAELKTANEAKDKFFRIISHDLKGPVSSFDNLSSLLMQNFDKLDKEKLKKHLANIDSSSSRLNSLLENLLTWSRMQSNNFEPEFNKTNMNKLFDEEINNLKSISDEKEIQIINNLHTAIYTNSDENMIREVIRNLLANAIKFSYRGGKIAINFSEKNEEYDFYVKDYGTGIAENVRDNLFDISNKSNNNGTEGEKGTGLGLYLAKEFIEKNKGKIYFLSENGKGTEFHFSLNKY
jgi:signal transduction histidine kinase